MKSYAIQALIFGPLALAVAVNNIGTRQEELAECCYLWKDSVGNSQLFRSTSLSQQDIGEPGSWCIAQIERDASDPNNCAAGKATIYAGYCPIGDVNMVVTDLE
ncbi:hypothetical protein INS49_006387 [Diaporthe citri]|uniref:uncharacterized protein n=1 Tax=Diaporthe citri TaxID=83186 RepID=UPI001C816371|nr:uncharacterized protein INS49_006387 [Diaporthe citri]KAG6364783.1 hypothetical protein INS49_006387 [Diaporthe citri]